MLTPTNVDILSFFYPVGNTPAVCLTQDLPGEEPANVLLLGCGDVRNILFTTYASGASSRSMSSEIADRLADIETEPRSLDITCCDMQAAILSRNILLLTLLVDDPEGSNDRYLWNIYYHLFLEDKSRKLVQTQSQKLHGLTASIQSWRDSKYGRLLRFCDQGTLTRVREIWKSYSDTDSSEEGRTSYDKRFKSDIKRAVDIGARLSGSGPVLNLTGFRSAAPVGFESLKDLPDLHQHFWDHGITERDRESLSKAEHPNPLFASMLTDTFTLHYGTNPLLGFHLATAYLPFTSGSPLHPESPRHLDLYKVVEAARLQFRAWGNSFKICARQSLTLRFFVGEALALCHTLQHRRLTGDDVSANWYRGPSNLEQLILDGEDYATAGTAPLSFNVIDTSNLMDHVGAINLLVATAPLLDRNLSATLYTESLVRSAKDPKAFIDSLLCGHFPTISILLGLFPVEYWTNATATSTVDESILDAVIKTDKRQMYTRLAWKQPISTFPGTQSATAILPIHFDETEMAQILYQIYLKMFQHEDMSLLFSKIDLLTIQNSSCPRYHRGSLASFLCFVKKRVVTNWDKVMDAFLDLIENDSTIALGMNYIQELYLQLHLLGVYTMESFRQSFNLNSNSQALKDLCAWNHIPEVVCVTIQVPRPKLGVFTELPIAELGTPLLHCSLHSSRTYPGRAWHNLFAVIHLAFGEATTSGSRSDDDFRVNVREDRRGWKGSSAMFISFYAPRWVMSLESRATRVALGVQTTPHTAWTFLKALGVEMNVYETNLGNEDNVYITKHRPNQSGYPSVCNFAGPAELSPGYSGEAVRTTIAANVDPKTTQIVAMTGRVTVLSEDVKSMLRNGANIETIQKSPCILAVVIGKSPQQHYLRFPAPVLRSRSKVRIARKSSYVEVVAPMCDPTDEERFPQFMYPLFMNEQHPVIWNMPRLNLDCLPILDTGKTKDLQWLITHASLMFSTRERTLRGKSMIPGAETHKDVRVNFKDSLFSMFMHFTGLQGRRSSFFGISNPSKGGIHILIFVSCMRLDVANHTVVLDATVLPLNDRLVPKITQFLGALTGVGICQVQVDDEELRLWKQVIPAMVERCRQWEHRPSCEYLIESQIPLSVENGQTPICSCGNGKLPANFISGLPHWETASKYAVRVAISPSFSVPFVEDVGPVPGINGTAVPGEVNRDQCKVCGEGKSSGGTNLLKCGRCHDVKYCSAACQRADWKEHKKVCTK